MILVDVSLLRGSGSVETIPSVSKRVVWCKSFYTCQSVARSLFVAGAVLCVSHLRSASTQFAQVSHPPVLTCQSVLQQE